MVGLMSLLLGEVLFEGAKFIIMLLLLVVAAVAGGKIKAASDAKKAKKSVGEQTADDAAVDNN